jgi:hypothetical protein
MVAVAWGSGLDEVEQWHGGGGTLIETVEYDRCADVEVVKLAELA